MQIGGTEKYKVIEYHEIVRELLLFLFLLGADGFVDRDLAEPPDVFCTSRA